MDGCHACGDMAANHPVQHDTEFGAQLFAGATAWLVPLDSGEAYSVFTGTSMLLGPVWALLCWDFRNKWAAVGVVVGTGMAASIALTGTLFLVAHMLGSLAAPCLLVFYIVGSALLYAKQEIQKTLGLETDSERLRKTFYQPNRAR